jgi:hypothetical protein
MKRKTLLLIALTLCATARVLIAELSTAGVIKGPNGAFMIEAPGGWVLDNSSGKPQGFPCVLYLKGATWPGAEPWIYAKIGGIEVADFEAFAAKAIEEMKKERGDFELKKVTAGKTPDRQRFFVNEYPGTKTYPRWERVAYLQLPDAVAYIVLSAANEAGLRKYQTALQEVLKSFAAADVALDP